MFRKFIGVVTLGLVLAACSPGPLGLDVSELNPEDGATGVSVDTTISATFSVGIDEDSIDGAFTLVAGGGPAVAGDLAYDAATRTVTFDPTGPLAYATTYTATVSGTVATVGGVELGGDASWSFTTEAAPDPEPSIGGFTIDPESASLEVGGTVTLSLTPFDVVGTPDLSVTWSSDNEAAATVDQDGVVSAVAPGVAVVTATSAFDASVSVSATITVAQQPSIGGFAIDPESETVVVGGTVALSVTPFDVVGTPDLSVTWSSDNEAAATVDQDGVVSAVAPGVAVVTATSAFDASVSASATITVVPPSIGGFTVEPESATLAVGDTVALSVTPFDVVGSPDLSVLWTSDDDAVATVDEDGVVSAVAPGVAVVTATSAFDAGVSVSATITVATALEGADYVLTVDAVAAIELLPDVSGGVAPYTFTLLPTDPEGDPPIRGLPEGVELDGATGVISGAAEFAGFYRAEILVTDAIGQETEILAEIAVDPVLSYAQTTYTYAGGPAGVGPLMPASDITVIGSRAGVLFTMTLDASGPTAGPENAFTIDEDTGVVSRMNVVATTTTAWTYTVTATDFDSGRTATFTLTINRLD